MYGRQDCSRSVIEDEKVQVIDGKQVWEIECDRLSDQYERWQICDAVCNRSEEN